MYENAYTIGNITQTRDENVLDLGRKKYSKKSATFCWNVF